MFTRSRVEVVNAGWNGNGRGIGAFAVFWAAFDDPFRVWCAALFRAWFVGAVFACLAFAGLSFTHLSFTLSAPTTSAAATSATTTLALSVTITVFIPCFWRCSVADSVINGGILGHDIAVGFSG